MVPSGARMNRRCRLHRCDDPLLRGGRQLLCIWRLFCVALHSVECLAEVRKYISTTHNLNAILFYFYLCVYRLYIASRENLPTLTRGCGP